MLMDSLLDAPVSTFVARALERFAQRLAAVALNLIPAMCIPHLLHITNPRNR
jgi:hypothetical protein